MYEEFIELTNQIYWEGYAEQLAQENPILFTYEYNEFLNTYNPNSHVPHRLPVGESHHQNILPHGKNSRNRTSAKSDLFHW